MRYYRINELDFVLPDGWRDGTMNAFVLPPSKESRIGGEGALVITRDSTQPHADIHEYADRQMIEAAKRFPDYNLVQRRSIYLDSQPAIELIYTWLAPKEMKIRQQQAIIKIESLFMNFTLSMRVEDAAPLEEAWSTILGSIRLRDL